MARDENWVRDQVLAANKKIERDHRQQALYDANFKKTSQRALDRIGAFFAKEFGTQSINELAAMPSSRTDAAFAKFSSSFETEIYELREKEGRKRTILVAFGVVLMVGGVVAFLSKSPLVLLGVLAIIVGFGLLIGAFSAYPLKPNPVSGNQDLFLAVRCQQIADALRKRVNDKRADLGL